MLNGLVMRWRKKADAWLNSAPELLDREKLDSDVEMLVRHVEGLQ